MPARVAEVPGGPAKAAVRRVAGGEASTVRLGITPPVAPVLAPHLIDLFASEAPHVTVDLQRMWLPKLLDAVVDGTIDVALTCGLIPESAGIASEVFCAEPLLAGLRRGHRLAGRETIELSELAHEVLGTAPEALFPPGPSPSARHSPPPVSPRRPPSSPTPTSPPSAGPTSPALTGSC